MVAANGQVMQEGSNTAYIGKGSILCNALVENSRPDIQLAGQEPTQQNTQNQTFDGPSEPNGMDM